MTTYPIEYCAQIAFQVAPEFFGADLQTIRGKSSKHPIVWYRHMMMAWLRVRSEASLREIGQYFNGRDHSTLISAIKTVEDWVDTKDSLGDTYLRFSSECDSQLKENYLDGLPPIESVSVTIGSAFLMDLSIGISRDRCAAPAKDAGRMIFEEPDRV